MCLLRRRHVEVQCNYVREEERCDDRIVSKKYRMVEL